MAACPSCGRALAVGAKKCVYCAHGTQVQRRQELKIPAGPLPKRGGFPWRKAIFAVIVLVAVGAYFQPDIREKVDGFVRSLMSRF